MTTGGAPNPLLAFDRRLVVGHRGAAASAPENTLASFHRAVAEGADALEFDVHVTADGVPVVIHDPDLARTTDRAGAVAASTLAEVQAADAGARFTADGGRTFPFRGTGVRVPTLAEVLVALPAAPLLIELKTVAAQEPVRRVLEAHDAAHRVVLASAHHRALDAFRAPPWRTSASSAEIASLYFGRLLGRRALGARYAMLSVPLRHRNVLTVPTRAFVRAARALGAPVHVWTVDDAGVARRLWARGVAGVVTNDPARMVAARGA